MRLPRKQMDQHLEKKDYHLQLSLLTVSELSNKVDAIMQTLDVVECLYVTAPRPVAVKDSWLKVDPFPRYPPCTLAIHFSESDHRDFTSTTISDDSGNHDDDDDGYDYDHVRSQTFITQRGYRLSLYKVNHDVLIKADDDDDNHSLPWPIKFAAKLMVLNQKEDKDHITISTECTLLFPGDEPVRVIDACRLSQRNTSAVL